MPNYLDVELVQEHLDRATVVVQERAALLYRRLATVDIRDPENWGLRFDSPAEAVFFLWWLAVDQASLRWFKLQTQHEITVDGSAYRIDFVVVPSRPHPYPWKPIAVEIDGHAFHEKTREQVTHRNARDRRLQRAEWTVFHYSFSELTSEPLACVLEVLTFAEKQSAEASERYWGGSE